MLVCVGASCSRCGSFRVKSPYVPASPVNPVMCPSPPQSVGSLDWALCVASFTRSPDDGAAGQAGSISSSSSSGGGRGSDATATGGSWNTALDGGAAQRGGVRG